MDKSKEADKFAKERQRMIKSDLIGRGITDAVVLKAMTEIPREQFVLEKFQQRAYADGPLPIGLGQTISQPYIVALMTQSAELKESHRVLEIGTGSAYQAAVLSEIVEEVYTIEIIEPLHKQASHLLKSLNYKNISTKLGDGYQGWKDKAPFDAILITAATPKIPTPLIDQLKVGGKMVLPFAESSLSQNLIALTKKENGELEKKFITAVRFVPMTGEVRK